MPPNIKIVKDAENPEPVELMAKSVVLVADGFKRFLNSGLSERALIVLLQDGIGPQNISKQQIKLVLQALPRLKGWYTK